MASALARKAAEKGFTRPELAAAGLANRRGNDYFSGRLMFPLADARGRVVGYSARKLREDDPLQAKYVNSPEGDLFHKSAILYGLHLAKTAIGKQDFAAVVEGNTDVIALRQAGFEPVVASMGTALTERQLRELGRMTKKLYLCFDADAAGQEATLRGMELANAQGFDVKVVTLPRGQDPALQWFDLEGNFLGQWKYGGQLYTVAFSATGEMYVSTHPKGVSLDDEFDVVRVDPATGKMLGRLQARSHQLAIGPDGTLFPATRSGQLLLLQPRR